jgi:hypothetical protein
MRADRVGQSDAVVHRLAVDIDGDVPPQGALIVEHIAAQRRARGKHHGKRGADRPMTIFGLEASR